VHAIGFDDGPFPHRRGASVPLVGAFCSGTRFEGLLVGAVRRDGWNATAEIHRLLSASKFHAQVRLVLLDGLTFGGMNLVDLRALSQQLRRPCVAVLRRPPDLAGFERALRKLPRPEARLRHLRAAGPLHTAPPFVFQVQGASPDTIAAALPELTDRGNVPEPLRLAHLIGAAIVQGQSGKRA
jgi:endonuclease V-like protein UPF0215 family